ncbi:MAG: ferredoxin reductase family protein [Promicromonosporaceae bacterium]|nr:ferredoxin reductase family protein [Promicromonosporaceae bacterium]
MTSTVAARAAGTTRPARPRAAEWWHAAAVTVIWATSIAVAALWLHGGGVQALLRGGGEALTTAGRATGLAAANLLLYQVLLMARVPVFERGLGRDALLRLHRLTGFWSFWLMIAHVVLVVLGYAATAHVGILAQTWDFVVGYPGMLLATAGTLLLVAVVALSIRAARRRLRYESWHLLHLYAYLGVGLALPHQLWTGADFLDSPTATAYWWTLWAVAAACLVVFRFGVPLARSRRHDLRVAAVVPDGARGIAVRLRGRDLERLGARAGQFLVLRFLDGPGWSRAHPFSIAQAPRGDQYAFAVRVAGDGTERMARLKPGTRVLFEGPYGTMTGERRRSRHLLMLGAGAGVAPLVALLQDERWARGAATLVTRDHHPDDALLLGPISNLVERRGLRWFRLDGARTTTGSTWLPEEYAGWEGPAILRDMAGDLADTEVYVCGPGPWMDAVQADVAALGVPADRVHAESFTI